MLPFYLTTGMIKLIIFKSVPSKNDNTSFIALLKFNCEFNRKPYPDTSEEDIEELKLIVESLDLGNLEVEAFEEYFK